MAVWSQIKEHKVRFLKTSVMLTMFMGMGMACGIIGPTLLDLRQQVQASITTISYALTARAGGHAIGSMISKSQMSLRCFLI